MSQGYGDDRPCPRGDPPLHVRGIEVVRVGLQIGEDRHRLLVEHADDGPDVGDRSRDHFIPGADPRGRDCDVNGGGSRRAGHHMQERAHLAELLDQQRRLRALPVEERVLLDERIQALPLRFTPANQPRHRLAHRLRSAVKRELRAGAECAAGESCRRRRRLRRRQKSAAGKDGFQISYGDSFLALLLSSWP